MKACLFCLALLCGAFLLLGDADFRRTPSVDANASLPAHVKAAAGQVTLYADFDHADEKGVPLYLVNRSQVPLHLASQDGDLYFKLERQAPSGPWERVQSHAFSWCGNSYGGEVLQPGMHRQFYGHRPVNGERGKVRYAGYGSLKVESNAGDGLWSPSEADLARKDRLSLAGIPGAFSNTFDPEADGYEASRFAEGELSKGVAVLRFVPALGELPALRSGIQHWTDALATLPNPTDGQRQALNSAREVLGRPWDSSGGLEPLMQRCLATVKEQSDASSRNGVVASPGKDAEVAWSILSETAASEDKSFSPWRIDSRFQPVRRELWTKIFRFAADRLRTLDGVSASHAARLLDVASLANEFVEDKSLELLLESSVPAVVETAARGLTRRLRYERLAELARPLKRENQVTILLALAQGPSWHAHTGYNGGSPRRPAANSDEFRFWKQVIKEQPLEASAVLLGIGSPSGRPSQLYDAELCQPVLDFWRKEAARSEEEGKDFQIAGRFYDFRNSLSLITSWERPEDAALLRSLLSYRGYELQEIHRSTNSGTFEPARIHQFHIRKIAAAALKQMGQSVPADTVFETDLPAQGGK